MRTKVLLVIFLLSAALSAVAQGDAERRVMVNTVSVGADGKFEAEPDTAVVEFTVIGQAKSAGDAYEKASKAAERAREAIRASGLDPKAAELGAYALQPMYDWSSNKRKIVGHRVTSTMRIKIKDFRKVGALLTPLSDAEGVEDQSVNYILEDIEAAKQKAVEDAFNKARASAQTVARAGVRTLGDLAYASVDTFEPRPPVPLMDYKGTVGTMRARAVEAPTEEFTPSKIVVTAHVNALFNLK